MSMQTYPINPFPPTPYNIPFNMFPSMFQALFRVNGNDYSLHLSRKLDRNDVCKCISQVFDLNLQVLV